MSVNALILPGTRARSRRAALSGPRRRAQLESRWRTRLQEVTELSLAYHDAAAAVAVSSGGRRSGMAGGRQLRSLMNRAIAARRALAETEEALARLSAGHFGFCEHCAAPMPPAQLAETPEARYCPRCDTEGIPALPGYSGLPGGKNPDGTTSSARNLCDRNRPARTIHFLAVSAGV